MKKTQFLILTAIIISASYSSSAQQTALKDVLKERSDVLHETEQNSESLKSLNEEKRLLIDKLVDVNKRYDEISKIQTNKRKLTPVAISQAEIRNFIGNKQMGRCRITTGEQPGEYIIQKEKIKIRFSFLTTNSAFAPQLSIISGEQNDDVFQIEQPGYDPSARNLPGDMSAILRFRINADETAGEFTHAFFSGQRIHDQWFGQSSSLAITPLTCVMGM